MFFITQVESCSFTTKKDIIAYFYICSVGIDHSYFNCNVKGYIVNMMCNFFTWFSVFLFLHHHNVQLVRHHLFVCVWKSRRILAPYFTTTTAGVPPWSSQVKLVTDVPVKSVSCLVVTLPASILHHALMCWIVSGAFFFLHSLYLRSCLTW